MKAGEKSTITYRSGPNGELIVFRNKNDIIKIEKLMKIIDEMLEDFPKKVNVGYGDEGEEYDYDTYSDDEIDKWLERWLKKTLKP